MLCKLFISFEKRFSYSALLFVSLNIIEDLRRVYLKAIQLSWSDNILDDYLQINCHRKVVISFDNQWWIQDFPDGGCQPLSLVQKSIIWQDCRRKLHENERNFNKMNIDSERISKNNFLCNRGFHKHTTLAIIPILASESLLCENKKIQWQNVTPS